MPGRTNVVLPLLSLVLLLSGTLWMRSAQAADPTAGQAVFKSACGICHTTQAGRNTIGPSLFGVVGRKTGAVAGYSYSTANQNANITWTPEELDKYLELPSGVVPGTKMTYAGLKDAAKRADLIAYLELLK